eukprot:Skav226930  [mRNA]  locus=scaffold3020:80637:85839:+ [translate_table: standard]
MAAPEPPEGFKKPAGYLALRNLSTAEESAEVLTSPLQFFVTMSTYLSFFGAPPKTESVQYKKFQGQVVPGVYVVGRMWKLAWEDGQAGIYKVEGKSSTSVTRTNILIDSEDTVLGEDVFDDAQKKATQILLNQENQQITNKPNIDRACAMLGLTQFHGELDEILGEVSSAPCGSSSALSFAPSIPSLPSPAPVLVPGPGSEEPSSAAAANDDLLSTFDHLKARSSCVPTPRAEGKAKAKPKAKGKRVAGEPQEAGESKRRKRTSGNVENLDPNNQPTKSSGGDTSQMLANDETWFVDTKQQVIDLLAIDPPELEAEFKTSISEKLRAIAEVKKTFSSRRRMIRRRSEENQEPAMGQLTELDHILDEFSCVLKVLLQRAATILVDECVMKMEQLINFGAVFGGSLIRKAIQLLWQEDMKFQRWENMFGSSLKFLQKHLCLENGETHAGLILQQMTVILQNVLKNIPAAKVSLAVPLPDDLQPLGRFIGQMAQKFPTMEERPKFAWLRVILHAADHTPSELEEAINGVKNDTSSVCASFRAIPQGKKLLALAEEHNHSKSHLLKMSQEIKRILQDCESFVCALPGTKPDAAYHNFASLVSSLKTVAPSCPADDAASQKLLSSSVAALRHYGSELIPHHVMHEAIPWLESQCKMLAASKIISRPPAFHILGLNTMVGNTLSTEFQGITDLCCFYSSTGKLAESTDQLLKADPEDLPKLREIVLLFCQGFQSWTSAVVRLRCSSPKEIFAPTEQMMTQLVSLIEENCLKVWRDLITFPIQIATKIVKKDVFDKEFLTGASDRISDAQLLLTGLTDSEARKNMTFASAFLGDLISFGIADREQVGEEDDGSKLKAAVCMLRMFQNMKLVPDDKKLDGQVDFKEEDLKFLAWRIVSFYWMVYCRVLYSSYLLSRPHRHLDLETKRTLALALLFIDFNLSVYLYCVCFFKMAFKQPSPEMPRLPCSGQSPRSFGSLCGHSLMNSCKFPKLISRCAWTLGYRGPAAGEQQVD